MNTTSQFQHYRYRGARAMVIMHEQYLREFLGVWREAKLKGINLPETTDTDYRSLEHLLVHVLRAARGYMTWMCEKLNLPDPCIDNPPTPDEIEAHAERFLNHVLDRWRTPLEKMTEEDSSLVFKSRWGTEYCIDSMLEHAVMHPIRHTFQLRELMARQGK